MTHFELLQALKRAEESAKKYSNDKATQDAFFRGYVNEIVSVDTEQMEHSRLVYGGS